MPNIVFNINIKDKNNKHATNYHSKGKRLNREFAGPAINSRYEELKDYQQQDSDSYEDLAEADRSLHSSIPLSNQDCSLLMSSFIVSFEKQSQHEHADVGEETNGAIDYHGLDRFCYHYLTHEICHGRGYLKGTEA